MGAYSQHGVIMTDPVPNRRLETTWQALMLQAIARDMSLKEMAMLRAWIKKDPNGFVTQLYKHLEKELQHATR
jgi:hypothetical protein